MESNKEILEKINNGVYKPLKKSGRSVIWSCLHEIQKDDGSILQGMVYCGTCNKLLKYILRQTSNLVKHKCVHSRPQDIIPIQVNSIDKKFCFDVFMDFTIEDCRPFSIVEGSGFRKLIKTCIKMGAKYGEHIDIDSFIPSEGELSRKCKLETEEKKREVKPHIQKLITNGEAAVTIDLCSGDFIERIFLCATLHFQVDFKLVEITLGMKSMDFINNTPINIKKKLRKLFEEFGVTDFSNTVFVTDRGSNIVSALKDFTRINCSAHLFSNTLNDAFEATNELKGIISDCENIVRYLKKANKQLMLDTTFKSDCPTRWISNFAMFKCIFDNYGKIKEIIVDNNERRSMLNFNMSVLQSLVEICNDFEIIFRKLQSSQSPTLCFVVPSIIKVKTICSFQNNEEADIAALKTNILIQMAKWNSNLSVLHKVALFLYPPAIYLQQNELTDIKEFCITELTEMSNTSSLQDVQMSAEYSSPISSPSPEEDQLLSPMLLQISSPITTSASATANLSFFFPTLASDLEPTPETERNEVERYCTENVKPTDDFDVMLWWQNNASVYPKLSKLAMKIMTIPASSAPSERAFSLAGNIISEKRNQFEPKIVDSILFLHSLHKKNIW